jgi:hypothetical protein
MNYSSTGKKELYWAKITWILLHTFPKFIDDSFFDKNKTNILNMLHNICTSVPCPKCCKHASENLKKYNYFHKNINNSVKQLELNLYNFHNQVNKMLGKILFKETILQKYDNIHFLEIYKTWTENYVIKGNNLNLMNHKTIVNRTRNEFVNFINTNLEYFINKISQKKIDTKLIEENNIMDNKNEINVINKKHETPSITRNKNTIKGFFI